MVNALKVRQNRSQGSNFAFKVGLRTDSQLPNELAFWYTVPHNLEIHRMVCCGLEEGGHFMAEIGVCGIDLFKIAGESISGWVPSWKTGEIRPTRQPFCSQMEERLLLYLE